MRHIFAILLTLALPVFAQTRPLTVAWEASAEPDLAGYRVYVRTHAEDGSTGPWEAFAATTDLRLRAAFPAGKFEVGVSAFTLLSTSGNPTPGSGGELESERATMTVPPTPTAPTMLRLITESSDDLGTWTPIATQVIEVDPETGRKFFRTRIEPIESP